MRIYDWLRKTNAKADLYAYLGESDNQLPTLIRRPAKVVREELRLRRLIGELNSKTLIMSRQASPFSSGGLEMRLLRAAERSIYDFDDALFSDTESWVRRIWSKKQLWINSVAAADIVIAGSNILAEEASKHSRNVVMIPSCVEPRHYDLKANYDLGEVPRAVWIGSRATEPYLEVLSEPLLRLNQRYGMRVTVISGGNASMGKLDTIVDRKRWDVNTFAHELSQADFGIMPLPDTPYARGKCAYKILQYAATGLPIIGSPIGSNEEVIRQFGSFPATTEDEWYLAGAGLLEMASDQRAVMGNEGRRAVVNGYSFDSWKAEWLAAVGIENPRDPAQGGAGE